MNVAACVVDLAFVIDNSGSIRDNDPPGGNNWRLILEFVKSIIRELIIAPYATRIAVVDFGELARTTSGRQNVAAEPDVT